jgi:hypothetical protein
MASKRTIRRRVQASLVPRGEPVEFERIHFKTGSSRLLKNARSAREADATIHEMCRVAGVKKDVFLHSKIGNSIVELYVPALKKQDVVDELNCTGFVVVEDFNPAVVPDYGRQTLEQVRGLVVKRLAFLYRRGRLVNLKKCILRGYSEDIQAAVLEAATQPAPAARAAGATGIDVRQ